jgi:hypothetical protein
MDSLTMSRRRKRPLNESVSEGIDTFEISPNNNDNYYYYYNPDVSSGFHNALKEAGDGYDSDSVSVDDYIEKDFFSKENLTRKLVTSKYTIKSSAVKKSRHINDKTLDSAVKRSHRVNDNVSKDKNEKKDEGKTSKEIAYDALEKNRIYFRETIDRHQLTVECDNWT